MKTTSVTTLTQLNNALQDATVQRIRLLNDIVGNLSLTRKVDLALNGFKVTGNVGINHSEAGTVTIEAGTIEGDLTVNTPNATVVNQANVTGTASIQDVADNTFDNSGRLKKLEVTDPNGARIINHKPNLIETFIIDSPAPVELSGVFETVEILQDSFITFAENTTLEELKADENVSVEVIKPKSVEIKVAPTQMKESELTLDDATVIRKLRGLIEKMRPYLEKEVPDKTDVEQFVVLLTEANELSHILYQKDPRGTLTQQLMRDIATISHEFFEAIPVPKELENIAEEFKVEIVGADQLSGAHVVFPEVPEGIDFYMSSDYQVKEKYLIPARPTNDDEVRHVFASFTFSTENSHVTKQGLFHIPSGTGEITFELMDPEEYSSLSDYTTNKDFQLGGELPPGNVSSFIIRVSEGKTVEELLNSPLLAERKKQVNFTAFKRITQEPFTLQPEYQMEFNKEFNTSLNQIVKNDQLDTSDPNFVAVGDGGFTFDEMNKVLEITGNISSVEFRSAFMEYYTQKHPIEREKYLNVNFIQVLPLDAKLETYHQLFSESKNGGEGMFLIDVMPSE